MAKAKSNISQANLANLDPELVEEAMKLNKGMTPEEVLNKALRHYIIGVKNKELLDMKGKIYWDGDLNEMRSNRSF
ncbi:type II toxin-antitoxin system VapB family antitoxin [Chitinophaga eiseniae]|uniref:Type II toxin-antitoxin system VapB family antitoxin n=1 Tax=Chitinophaga eiseniae TaxID=634771 RepID=A0A847SPN3_9BACT|nr:type II toxin-antitoxin system VapB family antitoxin [Chitinophaga eiseniae]NLR79396.1 type II toxin-antitoxin system VapB family antitoxin [Chitinophaga eiseniae]